MYLVSYQKRNGDIFCRIRNTIPEYEIGSETCMGWILVDIKYRFKDNYYSLPEYHKLNSRRRNYYHFVRNIKKIFSRNCVIIILILAIIYLLAK